MTRERAITSVATTLTVLGLVSALSLADTSDWDPQLLLILACLVLGANLLPVEPRGTQTSLSGDFLGLVLAMALVGPAPAALLGFGSAVIDGLLERLRPAAFATNAAAYVLVPLLGALTMNTVGEWSSIRIQDAEWVLVMLPGFVVAAAVNYGIVFSAQRVLYGGSISSRIRTMVVPILPSELAMLLLAAIVIYAETRVGPMALVALVGLLFLYFWLYRELTLSQERGEELNLRNAELASLQVGVLGTMLRTLALRDHMTARHSAAVARYARALAIAYGCSEEDVELVHTAGLLHDIGKFIFPDHILLANSKLSDDDWEIVRCHPFQGAKLVRQVDGHGPVADIILAHHERVDGGGYPRGLKNDEIPLLSRMISVCDTYDVMTARTSYRDPVPPEIAVEELQRVSGEQLDGDLVNVFVELVRGGKLSFRHGDDADFERELQFDRRVHDYAEPAEMPSVAAKQQPDAADRQPESGSGDAQAAA